MLIMNFVTFIYNYLRFFARRPARLDFFTVPDINYLWVSCVFTPLEYGDVRATNNCRDDNVNTYKKHVSHDRW